MTGRIHTDPAVEFYDPAKDGYDLSKDPRCLFGWGPPTCKCRFGHACFREFGHPGMCDGTGGNKDLELLPCERRRRPKDWDTKGRAENNQ